MIQRAAKELSNISLALTATQKEMDRLASTLPEYSVVLNMGGVGTTLGPQIMAEIGDVRRFPKRENLIAFAGVDAPRISRVSLKPRAVISPREDPPSFEKACFRSWDVCVSARWIVIRYIVL